MKHDITKNKRPINRHGSKLFSFIRTVCKTKENSLHECSNIRRYIQDLISPNCGEFQLYFSKNVFDPDERSKILSHQTLNKHTLDTIINEIFSTDVDENKHLIKNFKDEFEL